MQNMHFQKIPKTTFVGISDDSEHVLFFYLHFFLDLKKKLWKIYIFKKCLKTTFVGISNDSEHVIFLPTIFGGLRKNINYA